MLATPPNHIKPISNDFNFPIGVKNVQFYLHMVSLSHSSPFSFCRPLAPICITASIVVVINVLCKYGDPSNQLKRSTRCITMRMVEANLQFQSHELNVFIQFPFIRSHLVVCRPIHAAMQFSINFFCWYCDYRIHTYISVFVHVRADKQFHNFRRKIEIPQTGTLFITIEPPGPRPLHHPLTFSSYSFLWHSFWHAETHKFDFSLFACRLRFHTLLCMLYNMQYTYLH